MRQYKPIISIIIPSYNKEAYLSDCLLSCINQTYKEIEIIVVDDCSSDRGINLAANILKESDFCYKIITHKNNKGLSAARNTGLSHASGKYIFFLDADDTIDYNLLEVLLSAKQSSNSLHVVPFARIRRFSNIRELNVQSDVPEKVKTGVSWELCKKNYHYYAWGSLLDRSIIEKYDVLFREDIKKHEDIIFLAEYLSHVHQGKLVESNYNYRVTPNSITSQCAFMDRINVLKEMYLLLYKTTITDFCSIITFTRILRNGVFLAEDYPFNYCDMKKLPHVPLNYIVQSKISFVKKCFESLLIIPVIEYSVYRLLRYIVKA